MNTFFDYPDLRTQTMETGRTYWHGGRAFPSVTTILRHTQSQEQSEKLENWRKRVGEEEAERIRNTSADIGSDVHQALENWMKGEDYSYLIKDENRAGLFENLSNRVSQGVGKWYALEQAVFHPEDVYAGRVDLMADWEGVPSIIDFKTKIKVPNPYTLKDHFKQLSAYLKAANYHQQRMGRNMMFTRLVILSATPTVDVDPLSVDITDSDFKTASREFDYRLKLYYKKMQSKHAANGSVVPALATA